MAAEPTGTEELGRRIASLDRAQLRAVRARIEEKFDPEQAREIIAFLGAISQREFARQRASMERKLRDLEALEPQIHDPNRPLRREFRRSRAEWLRVDKNYRRRHHAAVRLWISRRGPVLRRGPSRELRTPARRRTSRAV